MKTERIKKYEMTDTWNLEPPQHKTQEEILALAYELYCGNPVGQELEEARKVINTFDKAVKYIEQECGWRVVK